MSYSTVGRPRPRLAAARALGAGPSMPNLNVPNQNALQQGGMPGMPDFSKHAGQLQDTVKNYADEAKKQADKLGQSALQKEQEIRGMLAGSSQLAADGYDYIKSSILSNVSVDLQTGVSVRWDGLASSIVAGAGQLSAKAIGSLAGTDPKGITKISAGLSRVIGAAVQSATTGNWRTFTAVAVEEILKIIDNVVGTNIAAIAKAVSDAAQGTAKDALQEGASAVGGGIPGLQMVLGVAMAMVDVYGGLEDQRAALIQQYKDKEFDICNATFDVPVLASSPSGILPVDIFLQPAADTAKQQELEDQHNAIYSVYLYPDARHPHAHVGPREANRRIGIGWRPQRNRIHGGGAASAVAYGTTKDYTRALVLDDMQRYAVSYYRFGNGAITRVPTLGRAMLALTEYPMLTGGGVHSFRSSIYRNLRMAMQREVFTGDGGQSLLPIYMDMMKADYRRQRFTRDSAINALSHHFGYGLATSKGPAGEAAATYGMNYEYIGCTRWIRDYVWPGVETNIEKWAATVDNPLYADDQFALQEMTKAINDGAQSIAQRNMGKSPGQILKDAQVPTDGATIAKAAALFALAGVLVYAAKRYHQRRRQFSYR